MIKRAIKGWIGRPGGKGGLTRLLVFLLSVGLSGCAAPTTVSTPTPPPAPPQVPVRVSKPPAPKPETKESLREKAEKARREAGLDDFGTDQYAAAIKKVSTIKRKPKEGEKVYPLDLNLKNADLVEAVRVLGDTLGINYTIDPRVKGTANVRATGKLTETEILGIMETILLVNNATMVKAGNQYQIVPLEKSAQQSMPVVRRDETPVGMTAQVVFPEQTIAKDLVAVLKPLLSPGGNINEGAHNSLIIVDHPANLEKLLQLIHMIDTKSLAQTMVRVMKVENTDPNEIISEL